MHKALDMRALDARVWLRFGRYDINNTRLDRDSLKKNIWIHVVGDKMTFPRSRIAIFVRIPHKN